MVNVWWIKVTLRNYLDRNQYGGSTDAIQVGDHAASSLVKKGSKAS